MNSDTLIRTLKVLAHARHYAHLALRDHQNATREPSQPRTMEPDYMTVFILQSDIDALITDLLNDHSI